ncbi:hypothetical protein C8J56DRAFT_777486 [Mycena floridula]|nr:hypothetical protein C8J56DRAFT_777486 [Mycena floridula]
MATVNLHRRNPSHSDDENTVVPSPPMASSPRTRVHSTPMKVTEPIPSPFRSPNFSTSGALHGHSRTRSISAHSPLPSSPLSASFSFQPPMVSASASMPEASSGRSGLTEEIRMQRTETRRHARLHSRNLSVFFPRPGSLPQSVISEDGSQEIELKVDEEAPMTEMPSAGSASMQQRFHNPTTPLGAGFRFGTRPPADSLPTPPLMSAASSSSSASRRGHHHKHSLSHNFFSFLEPGGGLVSPGEELHTQPTVTPLSPWTPNSSSGFPTSPAPPLVSPDSSLNGHAEHHVAPVTQTPVSAMILATVQFILGAWLWVSGQQNGSLGCTGLGYWVVFDSFGIAVSRILPWRLESQSEQRAEQVKRPYGNARIQTVFVFAQVVYLMFSSVYVCKETVEHLLLSAGGGEGHHHHHGDEEGLGHSKIEFPVFLIIVSFISIVVSALLFDNHAELVQTTGNRIASPVELIRSWSSSSRIHVTPEIPSSSLGLILSNPYVVSPLFFCLSVIFVVSSVPTSQHRTCDLVLACLITVVTFNVAYKASSVLGTVLLQTSPRRGLSGGKMESFLRVMRELERHPQVMHLPAPHIWQLTPTYEGMTNGKAPIVPIVVTLELHVRADLGDDDILALTAWAWERCVAALGGGLRSRSTDAKVEVTVGVVRG